MINPLQAMQAARAANQTRPTSIQSQGAVTPQTALQRQQLNTGAIGQRMDARGPEMIAIDPNMYADRKQARDFQIMEAERQRQFAQQQDNIRNQRAIELEKFKNKLQKERALSAGIEAQELAKANQVLLDDRFKDLREPAGRVIAKRTAWESGAKDKFFADTYKSLFRNKALSIPQAEVDNFYKSKPMPGGNVSRGTPPKYGTEEYIKEATEYLRSMPDFDKLQGDLEKQANERTYLTGKQINDAYNVTLSSITKLGYSPQMDPNYNPSFVQNIPATTRPPLVNFNQTPLNPEPSSSGSTIIDAGKALVQGGKEVLDDALSNPGETAAIMTALGLSAAGLRELLQRDPNAGLKLIDKAVKEGKITTAQGETIKKGFSSYAGKAMGSLKKGQRAKGIIKETRKQFVDLFKTVAPDTKLKDVDILKIKPDQMGKALTDSKNSLLKRIGIKALPLAKGKVGRGVGLLSAGFIVYDLSQAVTPEQKREIEAHNQRVKDTVEAYNQVSRQQGIVSFGGKDYSYEVVE